MATDLVFVPGRNKGSENPVLNGNRYTLDKKKNDSSYWKCALYRTGCRARIVTVDKQLASPLPQHTQHAETAACRHPSNPRDLEHLNIPGDYIPKIFPLGYSWERRRHVRR